MAENLKALRRRIRSVSSTRKITHTMELISAAKLRRVQRAMEMAEPYRTKIRELVARLAWTEAAIALPWFEMRPPTRATALVMSGDRGLCGAYNNALLGAVDEFLDDAETPPETEFYVLGKVARERLERRGHTILEAETNLGGRVPVERTDRVVERLTRRFLDRETDMVVVIYNRLVSTTAFEPAVAHFLPLSPDRLPLLEEEEEFDETTEFDYIFEPSAERVFEMLMPRYVRTRVRGLMLEAMVTEHNARRLAMHNATENCDEMTDDLRLRANKARQAAVTAEILDIVGGAEALIS